MAQYDFSTLSSSDLEDLVCDLLNAEVPNDSPIKYKTFKDGKDQGIDLLYSTEHNTHEHVGQVKHYYRTGFDGMFRKLENEEVEKVKKLAPTNYIFATSVDLGVGDTKKISDIFHPYIKNLNDIYGKKDLNRLIESHEDILNIHYKLWFSDTSVLTKILNSDLQFRSTDFIEYELAKRIRFYVKTPLFDVVRDSLKENNFVIITGDPGVGKTTLAEMLTYEYINENYQLLYILDDIKEIDRVLKNDLSKQIFYFDDFLGSNSAEINKAQGSESALLGIIGSIKRMTNKKLIFTTRSIVLNTVIQKSDRFRRFSKNLNEAVFHLKEYSENIKEKLLRNHIDESEMADDLKSLIERKDLFDFITSHKNFNPRSVEFITSKENVEKYNAKTFEKYIRENFNNPTEIWKHAYEQQIDYIDRWLLSTLLTFNERVDINLLEKAFNKRIDYCTSKDSVLPINPFKNALDKLDKGFIIRKNNTVDFINPSLKDFLINYIQTDTREINLMVDSIKYIQQVSELVLSLTEFHNILFPADLVLDMMNNYDSYVRKSFRDEDLIHLATFVNSHFEEYTKYDFLVKIIKDINDWEALHTNYRLNIAFKKFVTETNENYYVKKALDSRTEEIVNELVIGEYDIESAVELLENLKDTFDIDFHAFDSYTIINHLDSIFSDYIFTEAENLKDWATDTTEVNEIIDKLNYLGEKINDLGLSYEINLSELDCDWDEIARINEFNRQMEKND
ncbi:nSTAND3 domain-containing NTPase [Chryseobacterium polytrichastri]|uniref:Novel STAND NTPase 3 domain-containing protein n=1 Tax=Chryseobacterium polytrichastri TaxID=1302687 RepID=A0A1M6ZTW9_9FLAO|nr:hypothetical protein [Chryseobacterium polytrichastri]SHL33763.1 hypothetical protein SAMN05444267_101634 [Chryseobacterium polytrichastri]